MGKVIYSLLLLAGIVLSAIAQDLVREESCTSVENCGKCENRPLECSVCGSRKTLLADGTGCSNCPSNCNECEDPGTGTPVCTTCDRGYTLLTPATAGCSACPTGCEYCNTTDVCHQCYAPNSQGKYYTRHTDGTCQVCPTSCETCTVNDDLTTTCTKCIARYALKPTDKKCTACPNNCKTCSSDGTTTTCSACDDGYVLDSSNPGRCLACPTSCDGNCNGEVLSGSTSKCTACKDGYYLTSDACAPCSGGCATCTSSSECQSCTNGYQLDGTTCAGCELNCKACAKNDAGVLKCSECNENYGVVGGERVCLACEDANCEDCPSDPAVCGTCASTHFVNANMGCTACSTVDSQCTACDNTPECSACNGDNGYYIDNTATPPECKLCSESVAGCKLCNSDGTTVTCTECNTGFLPDADSIMACHACESCPNCVTASAPDTCSACEKGYGVNGMTCSACGIAGCGACTFTGGNAACDDDGCTVDGYFDKADGMCLQCTDMSDGIANCAKCTYAMSALTCTECSSGYLVNGASTMCLAYSGTGCTAASADNMCATCAMGYYKNSDGTCTACSENCDACADSTGDCSMCKTGFVLDSSSPPACLACDPNCASGCSFDSTNSVVKCTACNTGYDVNAQDGQNDVCVACPTGCGTCPVMDGSNKCATCANYYHEERDDCGKCPKNCKKCSKVDGVLRCDDNQCKDKFALDSDANKCLPCPSKCNACRVSNGDVFCTECQSGTGISADKKSCPACSVLTTIANCASCTDATSAGASTCESCATGYTFNDDKSVCRSCGELTDCGTCVDKPFECDSGACDTGYAFTPNNLCAYMCLSLSCSGDSCPDNIESETNATILEPLVEPCFNGGACWAIYNETGGVISREYECRKNSTCPAGYDTEKCEGDSKNCAQCCVGNLCNQVILDGIPGSADKVHLGLGMLFTVLLALVVRA